ncbi:cation:proton antiporter [Papillibacter cinnamivorans]|uniref:Sodium/proton-potassium antiporter GerN, CPA2 family n=1 Tax=Papillibacter cinnamivorans DSM 12816 TaxID=1122930 RepID=A0A1W2A693_9FIRM|nr:cation:proton antiporter [Papillibacter cinnamivorans]SMC56180.1 sodium/proton-potassium antiporter GerN, CPA2 family [Papillibacter cinnamivorans DSM 12816]
MSYLFLFNLALILITTKLLSMATKKLQMPQVVGALLAGLLLGPVGFNLLQETDFIKKIAELGVIILMFTAGLETNITELKKSGKNSFVIALIGVLVPLGGGTLLAYFFNRGALSSGNVSAFLQNIFIGVILTATSVSITVETLKELGRLDTRAGSAILGAALIDDILGIIALTVITSFADKEVNVLLVLLKIVLFFVFLVVVGYLFHRGFIWWIKKFDRNMRRFVIVAFTFCLLLAFAAEHIFGVADITGAYFAGLIICNTQRTKYIASRFEILSYMLLSPVFFASIGIQVVLPPMSGAIILFSVLLLLVAVVTKIVGCGLGAKLCGYRSDESLQIGVGMISRGEVALIVANRGSSLGLISSVFFGPVILMVIITTILTPVLLKIVFSKQKAENKYADLVESSLVDGYQETEQLDLAEQHLLKLNDEHKKKPPQTKK